MSAINPHLIFVEDFREMEQFLRSRLMGNEVLQVLVIVGKGMQRGALLKVINPDGSEAEVHHHVSMDIQPDEFRGDSFQFAKRHGEPSFVVLANFMKHKLGFSE